MNEIGCKNIWSDHVKRDYIKCKPSLKDVIHTAVGAAVEKTTGGPGQAEGNLLRATSSVVYPAMRATTAIVPRDICREVPRKKYKRGGKKEVYRPLMAGSSANMPYAIPYKEDEQN